jgi:hypothetical protein
MRSVECARNSALALGELLGERLKLGVIFAVLGLAMRKRDSLRIHESQRKRDSPLSATDGLEPRPAVFPIGSN